MDASLRQELIQAAGPDRFSDRPVDRQVYAYDASRRGVFPPQAVVTASDTGQVSRVLAVCHRHRLPVVGRGAGSGMTGGSLALRGGLVLDLSGMNRVLAWDLQAPTVTVQPGVITGQLQAQAKDRGLMYPPDPSSAEFCTLGGNLAENAGGLRAVRYGVTRDYILAARAVLPDGRVFTCRQGDPSHGLLALLVGSEGTLALVTEITLRLLTRPPARTTLSAWFADSDRAADGVRAVLASGIIPAALEFIDQASLDAVKNYAGLELPHGAGAMLLLDLDGEPAVLARQRAALAQVLAASGALSVETATDQTEAARLWKARKAISPAVRKIARGKLNEDVAVPLGALADMVRRVGRIARRRDLPIPVFGHAGDGNLHVNVMYDPDDPDQTARAHQAVSDVFAATLHLGGTLSGEHGVGIMKLGYVGAQLDPTALELMRGLKAVFDPHQILNPGKAIPGPEMMP